MATNRTRPPALVSLALAALLAAATAPAARAAEGAGALPLGTFEQSTPGQPPAGWKARGGDLAAVYVVREEGGRKYVHGDARGSSVQMGREQEYDVRRYPILTWRWRVLALPTGGDERKKETGDSAAGVYVVFGGWPIPRTIKYVWSSSLPPGTRTESPFAGKTKIVVLESGMAKAGRWVEERANVSEDYRRFFGEDPGKARGIAILSDADNTRSRAVADYGAIVARAAGAGAVGAPAERPARGAPPPSAGALAGAPQ